VIALLGTGIMGAGMGRNVLRAGMPLRAWNRTRSKAEGLAADGATVCDSPADAVRGADIIVTMLADGPTVRDVMEAAAGGLSPGQVWAQTSTVGVASLEPLAALARDHGVIFLDSPVLGTRQPAERGQLVVFAAGSGEASPGARERVAPLFGAIGQKTVWLDGVGAATRLKLVANSWVLALTSAIGESLALARGLGVDPDLFLQAVSGGPLDCPYLHVKADAILGGDFTPSFSVSLAEKDTRLILEAGQTAGLRMDVTSAAAERFRRAAAAGHAAEDMAAGYFASFNGAAPG
jgi:3-hydroxyisobutyrate dehydrogenase